MVPVTIVLVGYDEKYYLGVKVTIFDPQKVKESGFFLTVDQADWERSDMEKSLIRKKEKSKMNVLVEYYKLPNYIKGSGGEMIFGNLAIKSRKDRHEAKANQGDA